MKKSIAYALAVLALSAPAWAADSFKLDPEHTWVHFTVRHAPWATAMGRFNDVKGDIVWDRDNIGASSLKLEIASASVDTNHAKRDEHLRSPDFFNAAEFPAIVFESTGVEKTGENTGKITGNLTLLGVTKPVTLDAAFYGEAPLPWDANVLKAGFSATTTIVPGDFGMAKVVEFGMGPEVKLMIETEAIKQ